MDDSPRLSPNEGVSVEVIEQEAVASTERGTARRIALQVLYEVDLAHHPVDNVIASHRTAQTMSKKVASYLRRLVGGVIEHQLQLDMILRRYAPEWPLEQLAIVDRNILRLALYELIFQPRTPVSAVIDEAVSLARLFGAEGALTFVNGVLGAVGGEVETLRRTFGTAERTEDGEE